MRRPFKLLVIGMLVCVPAAVAVASTQLNASPSSVAFGTQCTHTSGNAKPVVVTNEGPDAATNVTVSVSPSAMASVFPLGGQTSASQIAQGGSMQVQMGFVPQHVGANSATAVVTYTDPGFSGAQARAAAPSGKPSPTPTSTKSPSPTPTPTGTPTTKTFEIPLSGTAIDRWIDVNPPGVNFGSVHTGKSAPNQTITMFDDGDSPLTITSMFLGGRQPGDFTVSGTTSGVVTDGHPISLTLGFHPKAAGARAANLIINSNSCSGAFTVQLGGIAVEQDITASPKSIDFANVQIGSAPSRQLAIVNQGGATLTVRSIQMINHDPTANDIASFTMTGVPKVLPMLVKPGQPINLTIGFKAADTTPRAVDIKVTSNDPDTPILTIPLTAVAVPKPTPTPTETAVAPPPTKPTGGGFHLNLGAYVPTVLVGLVVAAFFAGLIFTRRRRGIPE